MLSFFTIDRISIVLDTLSFFLITTDLFGNKRLERLKQKILTSNPDIEFDEHSGEGVYSTISFIFIVLLVILYAISMYINFDQYKTIATTEFRFLGDYGELVGWLVIIIGLGLFAVVSGSIFAIPGTIIFFVLFYGRFALLFLIKTLLKFTSMEGLLLVVGTVIFLISRVLSFIYGS
jgi:hypothetical protein